jgi:phenylpropionate dioxygenase-like ring-hydroxylating dioxygenase large terminal subunit
MMSEPRERLVSAVADHPLARQPLPDWPQGWYTVARSCDLRPGGLRRITLAQQEIVVFRTASGLLGALDAHCPHMGAHLGLGKVRGEHLECRLHCWRIGADGHVPAQTRRARAWRITERAGLVMLEFGGDRALPTAGGADFIWTHTRPIDVAAHWHALTTNAFDMPHLTTVHQRELAEPPAVSFETGRHFEMSYVTRVRGCGASDRLMKWLSGNRIQARMQCHGPMVVVDTDLGFTRTAAMIGMLPTEHGTRLFGAFGIRPGPLAPLRLWLTKWLFAAFLKRDLGFVEGMRLRTDVDDAILQTFFDYLRTLRPAKGGQ